MIPPLAQFLLGSSWSKYWISLLFRSHSSRCRSFSYPDPQLWPYTKVVPSPLLMLSTLLSISKLLTKWCHDSASLLSVRIGKTHLLLPLYSDPGCVQIFLNFAAQVTLVMSVKVLQSEGHVIPISGKLCHNCKNNYDVKFGGKQTEKVVVYVPRTGKN